MSIRTPIARVRGLGAAKSGVGHFWVQRLTAIALVPLTVWLVASVIAYSTADYDTALLYLRKPVIAALLLLFLIAGFLHLKLGLQVVIEDYIHREGTKIALVILNSFFCYSVGALALIAVLKIAFGYP